LLKKNIHSEFYSVKQNNLCFYYLATPKNPKQIQYTPTKKI